MKGLYGLRFGVSRVIGFRAYTVYDLGLTGLGRGVRGAWKLTVLVGWVEVAAGLHLGLRLLDFDLHLSCGRNSQRGVIYGLYRGLL